MTTAEILTKAADLIEPDGAWTQGGTVERNDGVVGRCALSAVAYSVSTNEAARPTWTDVVERLREHLGTDFIAKWNDAPGRTQAEVVQALRDAAKAAA